MDRIAAAFKSHPAAAVRKTGIPGDEIKNAFVADKGHNLSWIEGSNPILDFRSWILDLISNKTTEHQLSTILIRNLNSKIQNQARSSRINPRPANRHESAYSQAVDRHPFDRYPCFPLQR